MEPSKTEKRENVMLIAMSTLPRFPKINTYQIEENGKMLYFKSLSQMEPHTKYVIYKLASAGETLDRIVILESEKAGTETPENWGGETATSLYRKRLINYLGGNEEIPISIPDELETKPETILSDVKNGQSLPGRYFPKKTFRSPWKTPFISGMQQMRSVEKGLTRNLSKVWKKEFTCTWICKAANEIPFLR